jgi:hypothetical protein
MAVVRILAMLVAFMVIILLDPTVAEEEGTTTEAYKSPGKYIEERLPNLG